MMTTSQEKLSLNPIALLSLCVIGIVFATMQFMHNRTSMREIAPAQYMTLAEYVDVSEDASLNALVNLACRDGKIISREHVPIIEHIIQRDGSYQFPHSIGSTNHQIDDARQTLAQSMSTYHLQHAQKCATSGYDK